MRIDRTHRPWAFTAAVIVAVSLIGYVWYASTTPGGPRGGTAIGLTFGIVGYAFMLFEGFLGARKKVPIWRLGKAQSWMRGHLWIGLVTLPLILFHAGFAFRGPLTLVLMLLFFAVYLSGIVGAVLQHYLPSMITARVPLETIYEEIPHVRQQLRDEADELVSTLSTVSVEVEHDDKVRFQEAYKVSIRPFLDAPRQAGLALADEQRSVLLFDSLRRTLPAGLHPVLVDLQGICEEERQFMRQRRFYHWLHVWLVVHVPLSIALLVMGGVHAIVALRY
jgi:hypothetical protein